MSVIPKVEEPDSEELRELYDRLSQASGGLGVLNIFKVIAHNPQLLRGWLRMATPLLAGGLALSPRLREIAILRVAQLCRSEYEFAHHIRIAADDAKLRMHDLQTEMAVAHLAERAHAGAGCERLLLTGIERKETQHQRRAGMWRGLSADGV